MDAEVFSRNEVIKDLLQSMGQCRRFDDVEPTQRMVPEVLCRQIETMLKLSLDDPNFLFGGHVPGCSLH